MGDKYIIIYIGREGRKREIYRARGREKKDVTGVRDKDRNRKDSLKVREQGG